MCFACKYASLSLFIHPFLSLKCPPGGRMRTSSQEAILSEFNEHVALL